MRIKEIITEATRQGMGAKTRVAPDVLNMIAQKSAYDKEVAQLKSTQPKDEKPKSNLEPDIKVYQIYINPDMVRQWHKTHDKEWAINRARGWLMSRLPDNIKDQILSIPEYQKLIIDVWNLAEKYLEAQNIPTMRFDRRGYKMDSDLEKVGIDKSLPMTTVRNMYSIIGDVLKKNNMDKFGRRLAPQR